MSLLKGFDRLSLNGYGDCKGPDQETTKGRINNSNNNNAAQGLTTAHPPACL